MTGSPARFESGAFAVTPGALELLSHRDVQELLQRHLSGDWGDLGTSDRKANDYAPEHGERLLSAYETPWGRIWIITEAERASTCTCCRANTDEGSEHDGG